MSDTSQAHNAAVNRERQDMNLVKLIERFGSEDRCRAYLETLRWPDGVTCPECESTSVSRIATRHQYDCNRCRTRFSVMMRKQSSTDLPGLTEMTGFDMISHTAVSRDDLPFRMTLRV